ncbi:SH3 domain-containing protein [Aquibium sp. A9E412]|uniref:SH3 domain-containing protein n=1 Tax=Aquibium sp. A9E412 TaxID=2976767 RepID=UPI0025AFE531|nr:SH3 domain-containing protein [Aquibium sp. A9E412]MDN2568221.1 SH3 domain-containing protein [Aquibium sp. A9E412]
MSLVALVRRLALAGLAAVPLAAMPAPTLAAAEAGQSARGPSGLPLPRFVSLKSSRVNMRVGPGLSYAVDWLYLKAGLPMEIVQEYDNWRRVRDAEGAEGWINQALLSGRRTAVAAPWFKGKQAAIPLLSEPERGAPPVAQVEPGAIGTIRLCNGDWCKMTFAGTDGWIDQAQVWGAYPGETIEE